MLFSSQKIFFSNCFILYTIYNLSYKLWQSKTGSVNSSDIVRNFILSFQRKNKSVPVFCFFRIISSVKRYYISGHASIILYAKEILYARAGFSNMRFVNHDY
jgi:hypothetical protein